MAVDIDALHLKLNELYRRRKGIRARDFEDYEREERYNSIVVVSDQVLALFELFVEEIDKLRGEIRQLKGEK